MRELFKGRGVVAGTEDQPPSVATRMEVEVTVFDPDTIEDKATFVDPRQTSVGFRHVIVNGTPIILDAERIADARPGRPVRRQV